MEKTAFGHQIVSYLGDVDTRSLELVFESQNEYIQILQNLDYIMTYIHDKYKKMKDVSFSEYSEREGMKIRIQYFNDDYYGIQLVKKQVVKTFYLTIFSYIHQIYDHMYEYIDLSLFTPSFIYGYFSDEDHSTMVLPSEEFVEKLYDNFGGDYDLDRMLKSAIRDKYHFLREITNADSFDHFLEPIHDKMYHFDEYRELLVIEEEEFDSEKSL